MKKENKILKRLAKGLVIEARRMREVIINEVWRDAFIKSQYEASKDTIGEKGVDEFAELYSQTITYGLFMARLNKKEGELARDEVGTLISTSSPFLERTFSYISGDGVLENLKESVEGVISILNKEDPNEIFKEDEDPVIHFYETFLAEYDSKKRKERGVWYTPKEIVDFIVSSTDYILEEDFNLKNGLGNTDLVGDRQKVTILDPAMGTGTFLVSVVNKIKEKVLSEGLDWEEYVEKHLIEKLIGFEVMIAPYMIALLNLEVALRGEGDEVGNLDRALNLYLTNTLERDLTENTLFQEENE